LIKPSRRQAWSTYFIFPEFAKIFQKTPSSTGSGKKRRELANPAAPIIAAAFALAFGPTLPYSFQGRAFAPERPKQSGNLCV
jgi:hypothetical protein